MANLLRTRPAKTLLDITRCPRSTSACGWLRTQCLRSSELEQRASWSTLARHGGERVGQGVVARKEKFCLNLDTVNPFLRNMEYAVRGPILNRALEIEQDLKKEDHNYPFRNVIYCNIGDVQAMGNQPLTYIRQLLTVCLNPHKYLGLENSRLEVRGEEKGAGEVVEDIPTDVRERALILLRDIQGHSLGTYTDSRGISVVRKHIADFITKRDGTGFPADPNNIFLLNGATDGIKAILFTCMDQKTDCGVMIPIPQYPIYTASIAEFGAKKIEYYLDEDKDWAVDIEDMRRSVSEAHSECQPRVLVVINPGNPTGQCLEVDNMREIVRLCQEEGMLLIADEVYQENIYDDAVSFTSFRKVVKEMEATDVQLISFNSISKGYVGECGMRGGYMDMLNVHDDVIKQIYKLFCTKLCPNSLGQVVIDAMVSSPEEGSPSYKLFREERSRALQVLCNKAEMVYDRFNAIPSVSCNRVRGSMYAFPRVHLPPNAVAHAKSLGMAPDAYYCMQFLERKGVCVVPGSGFGQREGTWHFRTTILPSETALSEMLDRFEDFHVQFMQEYD